MCWPYSTRSHLRRVISLLCDYSVETGATGYTLHFRTRHFSQETGFRPRACCIIGQRVIPHARRGGKRVLLRFCPLVGYPGSWRPSPGRASSVKSAGLTRSCRDQSRCKSFASSVCGLFVCEPRVRVGVAPASAIADESPGPCYYSTISIVDDEDDARLMPSAQSRQVDMTSPR